MDNMKNLKILVALVLVLTMVFSLVGTALAATGELTLDEKLKVYGMEVGDTVKFYRVLENTDEPNNDTNKIYGGWKFATGFTTLDLTDLQELTGSSSTRGSVSSTLAGKIGALINGSTPLTPDAEGTAANLSGKIGVEINVPASGTPAVAKPGLYIAIITPVTTGYVYNPVFVSADYYRNTPSDTNEWTIDLNNSYSDSAMAKRTPITVTKTASEASEATNETQNAKAVGVGDVINFVVETTIPNYASNYTAPYFAVSDTLSAGLKLDTSSVKVYTKSGETETVIDTSAIDSANSNESDTGFTRKFTSAYVASLTAPQKIVVRYSATITAEVAESVNEEDNTVTVQYSHNPTDTTGAKKVRDKTHHYSFTIDGNIWGTSEYHATEVVKVGLNADGTEITQETELDNGKKIGALEGAEFKLYTNSTCTTEYNKGTYATAGKIVSGSDGRLSIDGHVGISGLDAGEYWLLETKAPDGYVKQQNAVHIEIIPTYYDSVSWTDTDGCVITCDDLLKSYTVKVDGNTTATYTVNYTMNGTVPANDTVTETSQMRVQKDDVIIGNAGPITTTSTAAAGYGKIKNTKGLELPSTGGIGTTIFYVVGIVMVLGAAAILVARRKSEQE